MMKRILIIGAGFGGLATAAELSSEGFEVTVLEAHTYPGGSAGTFFHKGYRFDAGATLAGGFAEGGIMDNIARRFDIDWGAQPTLKAMQVHLPPNLQVTRWSDKDLWREERSMGLCKPIALVASPNAGRSSESDFNEQGLVSGYQ